MNCAIQKPGRRDTIECWETPHTIIQRLSTIPRKVLRNINNDRVDPRKQFRERADLRSFQPERPSMSRCLTISQVCRPGGLQFTRWWLCSHFGALTTL
ncbi:hypothetical protein ALC53_06118 [Atta colombica]|uniref:Uncharacterized protein n=1 Tax=Atta colombica TaxID=520822 RepID=A0A195BGP0_9HYME|nr:hypothetical protein ALC53_06118 [Atta colombica]